MGPGRPKRDADEEPCWIIMYHRHSSTDREGSPSQLFQPRRNPTTALPIPPSPTSLPVHLSHVSTASGTNSDETFLGTENSLPPPLFSVTPPPAASCLGSLLFSQEISQTSPEVDLVHSKISACQGVLRLLHSFAAQCLSHSLSPIFYLSIWPLQQSEFRAPVWTTVCEQCFSFVLSKTSWVFFTPLTSTSMP